MIKAMKFVVQAEAVLEQPQMVGGFLSSSSGA
jgi:hypothetical protein